ncbi:hypothetical protein ACFLUU_10205, partial [Chloroflexota bacterium]
ADFATIAFVNIDLFDGHKPYLLEKLSKLNKKGTFHYLISGFQCPLLHHLHLQQEGGRWLSLFHILELEFSPPVGVCQSK